MSRSSFKRQRVHQVFPADFFNVFALQVKLQVKIVCANLVLMNNKSNDKKSKCGFTTV